MVTDEVEITDEALLELQREAGQFGDTEQWQLCADALSGDLAARAACAEVVAAARAMLA